MKNIITNYRPNYDLISYIIHDGKGVWCLLPAEYWIMNHWGQLGIQWDLPQKDREKAFLEKAEEFKVEFIELANMYNALQLEDDEYKKKFFVPLIFADFDRRHFYSRYGEVDLENSLLENWDGRVFDFREIIPIYERFWQNQTSS